MTVENTNPIQHFTANGETTVFAISFAVEGKDNIKVTVNGSVVSVNDYIYDALTKAVVFNAAPEDGVEVIVERVTSLDRSINYQTYDNSFRPETLNYDLDRIWHVLQEDKITDAEILARIKDEIEWRRTHNTEWDLLAQTREQGLFNALKSYMDAIGAMSVPNLFDGITDNVVITEEGVSQRVTNRGLKQAQAELLEALNSLNGTVNVNLAEAKTYTDDEKARAIAEETRISNTVVAETNRAVGAEAVLQGQINALGVGNKAYKTYAEMVADKAAITAKSKVTVTNDPDSSLNGDYQYDGTAFTKSVYDVLTQAKAYADGNANFKAKRLSTENLNNVTVTGDYVQTGSSNATAANNYPIIDAGFLRVETFLNSLNELAYCVQTYIPQNPTKTGFYLRKRNFSTSTWGAWELIENLENIRNIINITRDQILTIADRPKNYEVLESKNTKNLIDTSKLQYNKYVSTNGGVFPTIDNWAVTDFIPVVEGQTYTLSGMFGHCAYSCFATTTSTGAADSLLYAAPMTNLPHTFTAPVGAKYVVVNIYSKTSPNYSRVQLEQGSVATEYVSGTDLKRIKKEFIIGIDDPKPYEAIINGSAKNLFKKSEVQHGKYINIYGQLRDAMDWGASGFIPVEAGKSYTISGLFGYSGAAFYTNKDDALATNPALLYQPPFTAAKTLVAPESATVLVINLYRNNAPDWSNVQVEESDVQTAYESGDDFVGIKRDYIVPQVSVNDLGNTLDYVSKVKFSYDNNVTVTASDGVLSYEHHMRIIHSQTIERSMVSNFTKDVIDGAVVSTMSDDVAPPRLDTATVGANHGYSRALVTAVGHGKTVADIGSLWMSQDVGECILIDVIDADKLYITRSTSNASIGTNQLVFTHKSGATNTATINATSTVSGQWYPSVKALKHKCFVDGNKVELGKDLELLFNQDVVISETYEILSRASMIQEHLNNVGVRLTNYENAQSVLSVTNNYRFDTDGGITLESEYLVLAPTTLTDLMMIQSIMRSFSGGTSYYIPKVKPITAGGVTYDFEHIVNMSTNRPTASLYFTGVHKKDNENYLDRVIQLNNTYGFAMGFLPVLDAEYSVRSANTATKQLYIPSSSLKVYPTLIDKGVHDVDVGTVYSGVGYRKYFKRGTDSTAVYPIYSRHGDYFYMHWHSTGLKREELPEKLMGRPFTVSEKSPNVSLISKVAGSVVTAKVENGTTGYLVLKFD